MKNVIPVKDRILDISVNLARVSEWIFDESDHKQKLVNSFLDQTKEYISNISEKTISSEFKPTFVRFKKEFKKLLQERYTASKYDWAERALTWANILQHRAKLA